MSSSIDEVEWERRRLSASNVAMDAFIWAVKNGISAGEARYAIQSEIVSKLGSSKVRE